MINTASSYAEHMTREELSPNEMLVLYALVLYPDFKNRLINRGILNTHVIPNMPMIGCEMVSVMWGSINPVGPFEKKLKGIKDVLGDIPECVWAVVDPRNIMAIMLFKNYTQFHDVGRRAWNTMIERNLIEPDNVNITNNPFAQSAIHRYFEFASLLKELYGVELKDTTKPRPPIGLVGPSIAHLTPVERKVFIGILKNPEMLDSNISEKIGVTRQSVTKIRRKLEAMGFMRTIRVPDLKMLNLELLVGTYGRTSREFSTMSSMEGFRLFETYKTSRFFFVLSSGVEFDFLSVFKDFRSYQIGSAEAIGFFKKSGALTELPANRLMSISEMRMIREHEYAPLVEKNLPEE
jgi:hypothetical protein